MLTIHNLTTHRHNSPLFSALSLTFGEGSLLQITGPNGCGKTTLLETLAGLRRDYSGRISVGELTLSKETEHLYAELVEYCSVKSAMKPLLTVKQNLTFWAQLMGNPLALASAITFFDLENYLDTPYTKLSSGWQKRVSLARMLLSQKPIWLLDEPLTFLDEPGKQRLIDMIKGRMHNGGLVMMATHDPLPIIESITLSLTDWQ